MSDSSFADVKQQKDTPIEIDEEELKRLNQEMIVSDLITPDRLYVDLALIKDFNIGALLSFRDEQKRTATAASHSALYQSMIAGIPAYQTRGFNDIAHYFPAFNLTNEAIIKRLHEPLWSGYILHNAPITPFINVLQAQIAVNVNHSAVISKRTEIELVINTYPLHLNQTNKNIVGLYFAQLLKVRVSVVCLDVTTFTLRDVINYDEIYTYYLDALFEHEDIRDGYTKLKFIRKRLFVPRIFGNVFKPKLDLEQEARIIKSRCDILTMFTYMPAKVCSAVYP
jgi:hypothetical protein